MADPTSIVTTNLNVNADGSHTLVIKNAEAMVIAALAALNTGTGKVEFMDDVANLLPVGVVLCGKNGNNDTLTGTSGGTVSVVVRGGIVLKNVSVATASSVTNVGSLVYATDGQTMTLVRPSAGYPIGIVTAWNTSTYCDVYLFDLAQSKIWAAATLGADAIATTAGAADAGKIIKTNSSGLVDNSFLANAVLESETIATTAGVADAGKVPKTGADGLIDNSFLLGKIQTNRYKTIGTFMSSGLEGTSAITLHSEVSVEKYTIVSLHFRCRGYDAESIAGSQSLNLTIGGTPTTGGVLTITNANVDTVDDLATIVNATAITANNTVAIGNTVSLVMAAGGTGFTGNTHGVLFEIYALVQNT